MSDLPRVERSDDGHPVFVHQCGPRVNTSTLPLGADGWQWTADGGLTPSVHCQDCGIHGFWVGGENPFWRSC